MQRYLFQAKTTFLRLEQSLNNIIDTLGKYKVVNEKNAVVESPKLNLTLAKTETKDMNYSKWTNKKPRSQNVLYFWTRIKNNLFRNQKSISSCFKIFNAIYIILSRIWILHFEINNLDLKLLRWKKVKLYVKKSCFYIG